jgi:hypothetical protein
MRCVVFKEVEIKIEVLRVMALYSFVNDYQHFEGTHFLYTHCTKLRASLPQDRNMEARMEIIIKIITKKRIIILGSSAYQEQIF